MSLTRRSFLGTSLAVGASLSAPAALIGILKTKDAAATVFGILSEHLKINFDHMNVVEAFTGSLSSSMVHHQTPETFHAKIQANEAREELAQYVLQEFLISTNYLEFHMGKTQQLALLQRASDGRRLT